MPISLYAETYKGFSSFALLNPRFPCHRYLHLQSRAPFPAFNLLYGSFGANYNCLNRALIRFKRRKKLLEIIYSNEACRHGQAHCEKKDLLSHLNYRELNRKLVTRDLTIRRAIEERFEDISLHLASIPKENLRVIISLGLESQYTTGALEVLIEYYEGTSLSNYPFVINNMLKVNSRLLRNKLVEVHTETPRKLSPLSIWNNDGFKLSLFQTESALKTKERPLALFIWNSLMQNCNFKGFYIPPMKRSFCITDKMLRDYGKLTF